MRILDAAGDFPAGKPLTFYSIEEVEKLALERILRALPAESRETLLLQAGSKSHEEWLAESEWDSAKVMEELPGTQPLADFQP